MLFAEVVATSAEVAATSSRTEKRDAIASLLSRAVAAEIVTVVGYLVGEPRQGRIGIGWRTLAAAERPPAQLSTLTVDEVDRTLSELAATSGPGSAEARRSKLAALLERATAEEASFLARLLGGELRQGALDGVMTDAIARAAAVPAALVRRTVMLGGRLDVAAQLALEHGREGLEAVGLRVGRPVQPMLASTSESVTEAVSAMGEVSVEWKIDGIRIQVHRDGDEVGVWTRNLNDITDRLPEVVQVVRSLPVERVVLDGEAIGFDAIGRPRMFQDTVSWRGRRGGTADQGLAESIDSESTEQSGGGLRPFFFDVLHVDGRDLIDSPFRERLTVLEEVAGVWEVPGTVTDDPAVAETVLGEALAAGHEGVVVKAAGSPYEAGRRGKAWRKVKPVHTLDLVVLAVEWGHGRRRGWLSNIHLGARADDGEGFVMVGKTFKGLTDELLAWQTERFLALAEREEHWDGPGTGVVWVRPEQVVEVALDGVQRSTRYPGGVALRFARVLRYREDKRPEDADVISTVRGMVSSGNPQA